MFFGWDNKKNVVSTQICYYSIENPTNFFHHFKTPKSVTCATCKIDDRFQTETRNSQYFTKIFIYFFIYFYFYKQKAAELCIDAPHQFCTEDCQNWAFESWPSNSLIHIQSLEKDFLSLSGKDTIEGYECSRTIHLTRVKSSLKAQFQSHGVLTWKRSFISFSFNPPRLGWLWAGSHANFLLRLEWWEPFKDESIASSLLFSYTYKKMKTFEVFL